MDAKQEFTLYWMRLGRKCLEGSFLEECDEEIKKVEEWAAAGKAGLPPEPVIERPIIPKPMSHEGDGLKCARCAIEKIYWEHFPDCRDFNDQNTNTIDELIGHVKESMGRPGASHSFIANCQERLKQLEEDRTTAVRWMGIK